MHASTAKGQVKKRLRRHHATMPPWPLVQGQWLLDAVNAARPKRDCKRSSCNTSIILFDTPTHPSSCINTQQMDTINTRGRYKWVCGRRTHLTQPRGIHNVFSFPLNHPFRQASTQHSRHSDRKQPTRKNHLYTCGLRSSMLTCNVALDPHDSLFFY